MGLLPGTSSGLLAPAEDDGRTAAGRGVCDATAGRLRGDMAFKGSGARTPFSRGGDGKAALGADAARMPRQQSHAHALGVPTTRSLAVATTGERIRRDHGPSPARC